uniref:Uncharacterized protein n=1 Tax=Anguilla anguilla TaxID=7936 RepID=A0A0E9Q8I4_ANGAN
MKSGSSSPKFLPHPRLYFHYLHHLLQASSFVDLPFR